MEARQSLAALVDEIKTYACRSGIFRNLDPGRSAGAIAEILVTTGVRRQRLELAI